MSDPIPPEFMPAFVGAMEMVDADMADGAWMAALTDAAERFVEHHSLVNADPHEAMLQYLAYPRRP